MRSCHFYTMMPQPRCVRPTTPSSQKASAATLRRARAHPPKRLNQNDAVGAMDWLGNAVPSEACAFADDVLRKYLVNAPPADVDDLEKTRAGTSCLRRQMLQLVEGEASEGARRPNLGCLQACPIPRHTARWSQCIMCQREPGAMALLATAGMSLSHFMASALDLADSLTGGTGSGSPAAKPLCKPMVD